jgi:choice-of-anchor B domain-containing protein
MRLLNAFIWLLSLTLLTALGIRFLFTPTAVTSASNVPDYIAEYQQLFLADQEPPKQMAPMGATPCVAGFAGTYPCLNVDLMSFLPGGSMGGGSGSEIWGWTDPLTGKEYALFGRSNGTSFIDVTDPVAPVYIGRLPTHAGSTSWRELKTYADHVFIVSDSNPGHGMQVFDLTELRDVVTPPVTFSETAHYDAFGGAHNIAINEETGFAYVNGISSNGTICAGQGLHIINIQDPANPTYAGCFDDDGYTHDTQCVIYNGPDDEHDGKEICFASNEDTLTVVDVSDKGNPDQISRTGYTGSGYTHQGWLTADMRYFIMDDELDELDFGHNTRTRIWDLADLDSPFVLDFYDATTEAIDHNQFIVGDYAYQANYRAGLRLLDITDIANGNLTEYAYFDTYPSSDTPSFSGAWGVYPFFESGNVIVGNIGEGLFVVRPDLPGGLDISKSQPEGNPTYGETITYTISVTNTGDITATGVVVTDILNGIEFSVDGPTEILPGETATYLFAHTVTNAECFSDLSNMAEVTSDNAGIASIDLPVVTDVTCPPATLIIDKSQPVGELVPGNTITYTIWLTNSSAFTATGIIVTDTLNSVDTVLPGVTTLGPTESATYQFTYTITEADCHTDLSNTVLATSNEGSVAQLLVPVITPIHCEVTLYFYLPLIINNQE